MNQQQRQQAIDAQARQSLAVGDQHAKRVGFENAEQLLTWARANLGADDQRELQTRLNDPARAAGVFAELANVKLQTDREAIRTESAAAGGFASHAEFLASARERRPDHLERVKRTRLEVLGGGA